MLGEPIHPQPERRLDWFFAKGSFNRAVNKLRTNLEPYTETPIASGDTETILINQEHEREGGPRMVLITAQHDQTNNSLIIFARENDLSYVPEDKVSHPDYFKVYVRACRIVIVDGNIKEISAGEQSAHNDILDKDTSDFVESINEMKSLEPKLVEVKAKDQNDQTAIINLLNNWLVREAEIAKKEELEAGPDSHTSRV